MNNWTLSGKLGKDAETRTLDSGKTVITFSLATDEARKSADGQPTKETLWTRVSYFVQTANVAQYLKKGATVLVEGRPKAGHYTDKNGNVVDTLDMVCNRLEIMAESKSIGVDLLQCKEKQMVSRAKTFIKEIARVCDITDENGYRINEHYLLAEIEKAMKGE